MSYVVLTWLARFASLEAPNGFDENGKAFLWYHNGSAKENMGVDRQFYLQTLIRIVAELISGANTCWPSEKQFTL